MIKADKNFTIKNDQGFTSPVFNKEIYKIYVNVSSKISPMGTFNISGVVMKKSEQIEEVSRVDEETQETILTAVTKTIWNLTGISFEVLNDIQNTPDLDIITEASNVTKALLEEWNANVEFEIKL